MCLYLVLSLSRLRDHSICVITYVIASELARQLVLVGSTTRCPRSPERGKFSVVSFFPFCSLPLTALCYFSFDSLLWNKVVQATWAFVVSIEAPVSVQSKAWF